MKTQKIFLLAVALVLALFMLASCDAAQTAPDCFVFDDEPSFAGEPAEIEGEIIAVNEEYNLVAFETWSLATDGYTTRSIKVVDVSDNNRVISQRSWNKSPEGSGNDVTLDLSSYPVIKFSERYSSGTSNGEPVYTTRYDYYLIHKDREATFLSSSSKGDVLKVKSVSNVWLVQDENTLFWVNKNLVVMREIAADVADTYYRVGSFVNPEQYFQFEAEYCDYLYTWEFDAANLSQVVLVYDPNGIACAKYSPSYRGLAPAVYVMNNGNVLIQEQQIVEDGEEYDYVFPNGFDTYNMKLVTKIMDYKTGEITEVDFDYIISGFESNYSATEFTSNFPFKLADGYANQAYLVPFADGVIGRATKYVVLNDALEIQWSLNNKYLEETGSSGYYYIQTISDEVYSALAVIDGESVGCLFDWEGNLIFKAPANIKSATNDFYVTKSGIYNYEGELLFDIENSEFSDAYVEVFGNCAYFVKADYLKPEKPDAVYKFNAETNELDLIADGDETEFEPMTKDGAFVVINNKKSTLTIYDRNGDVALITRVDTNLVETYNCDDAFIIEVEVGGEHKAYIFAYGDQMIED